MHIYVRIVMYVHMYVRRWLWWELLWHFFAVCTSLCCLLMSQPVLPSGYLPRFLACWGWHSGIWQNESFATSEKYQQWTGHVQNDHPEAKIGGCTVNVNAFDAISSDLLIHSALLFEMVIVLKYRMSCLIELMEHKHSCSFCNLHC